MLLGEVTAFMAAALLTGCGTAVVRWHAIARGRLDVPNARSSHTAPTPRGGGLAIVVIVIAATIVAALLGSLPVTESAALALGGGMVAVVGYCDDLKGLSIVPRLTVHSIAAVIAVVALASVESVFPHLPAGVAMALLVLTVLWSINLFNFMDGIDGLAASQATFVFLASAALIAISRGADVPALLLLMVTAGACAGFLWWNWPPARIFMGDVGSGFLGFWIAAVALVLDRVEVLSVWTTTILMSVFIADATVTLFRRMLRRERWHEPHRSHAYQALARRWHGHRNVTLALWAVNLLLVLPLAALSAFWRDAAPLLAFATLAALVVLVSVAVAGGQGVPPADRS
jgi:Fuc2NAc and GlcNAc transferase